MTLTKLLENGQIKLSRFQKAKIGLRLRDAAKEKNISYLKAEEKIFVADYPDEFIPDMQNIVIDFLTNKKNDNA